MDFVVSEKRREVWNKELEILDEIKRLCHKHHLPYYAIGGTLLGAKRHGGFIPWDDDIDIVMFRDDYNKFLEICKNELKQGYFLQTPDTDTHYYYSNAKIRDSNSTAIRKCNWKTNETFNQGIFVDIIPLDNFPDDIKEGEKFLKKISRLQYCIKLTQYWYKEAEENDFKSSLRYYIINTLIAIVGIERFYAYYISQCTKYNNTNTKRVSIIAEFPKANFIFYRQWFNEMECIKFENNEIAVPKRSIEILEHAYGDWKTPKMNSSMHGDIFYDTNKPYSLYLGKYEMYKDDKWYYL